MSVRGELRNTEDFKVWYKKDGQAYLIVNEQEVLVEKVKGRISGTLREYQATGESDTHVSWTELLFAQWAINQQHYFILIAEEKTEVTGMVLRMVGDDLATEKVYDISDDIKDVNAVVRIKGKPLPGPRTLKGQLTILSANNYSIDGYLEFTHTSLQGELIRKFTLNTFSINLNSQEG
ncbi:hypothetical protein [Pseudomonas silesiensis]|uniref:hypothetical protein n=1 Tax=Pseudomonas silesiensis TaxID=1853130 RepID=UPI0030D9D63E